MPNRELRPRVTFDGKGRVLIPKWLREELEITKGTMAELEVYNHKIVFTILGVE